MKFDKEVKEKIRRMKSVYKASILCDELIIKKTSDIMQYVLFLEFIINIQLNRKNIDKQLINSAYDTINLCYEKFGDLICGK